MLKHLCLAFAGIFAFVQVASGAGTVPGFSLVPQFDLTGKLAPGCKLYVYQAGTVAAPQNAYKDTGLTLLQPNPMLCDAAGRLPQWFVADGQIKLHLTDKNGGQIFDQDNLLVIGPSSGGGGGGGSVDPTTILQTGDIKSAYGTGVLAGFVRANGRTIGSATSGATERANADTQALFAYLWGADANLAVSGGRGVSAAADFAANKTIALPDFRGRVQASLDDMGNSAAGRLSSSYFGAAATTLGAVGGAESTTLTAAQIPSITSSGTGTISGSTSSSVVTDVLNGFFAVQSPGSGTWGFNNTAPGYRSVSVSGSASVSTTSSNTGGAAHRTVQPTILTTTYIKL